MLAILKTEFTKRDALQAIMARDMMETTQKSKLDRLEMLFCLRAAAVDQNERDRYSILISRVQDELLQSDDAALGGAAPGNT